MADEFKSIRDNLLRVLAARSGRSDGERDGSELEGASSTAGLGIEANAARALLATLFARAGKSKDEAVQIIAREIGLAVAAMLKEPLALLTKHQKLQISFEFVPKQGHERGDEEPAETRRSKTAPRKKRTRRKRTKVQSEHPANS